MSTTREQLGQYQILGPIGAGGMGEVYVARDPSLGRKVAIKLLPVRLSGDRETLVRFTREARAASALNHPNIVTIYEVGMDKSSGSPYIVMEYIEGRDLRSLLADGPLSNRRTLDIAAQIADGLAAAHEQGIIHRDLKPENVMVTKDGYVKILDFGLAKMVGTSDEETDTARLDMPGTNPGTILGTVGYMSPEQATGKMLDFRSDQFALGAILYELATGKAAFEAENAIDTLSAILHRDLPSISRVNGQAPPAFCGIVDRLLSKNAPERYSSTRDLARDLHNIRDRFATQTRSEEIPRPPRISRQRLMIAAIAAVVLLLAGAAAVWQRHAATTTAAAATSPAATSKKYLAVMPFRNLTGDTNGQLVVEGLAETLSARLAHFASVQVMRPTTPEALAETNPQKAGHNLGANIVLTGSMQRDGDRMRIAYEIVDLANGATRARDLIEGSASDLFTIQDRLADSIAASLQLGAPAFRSAAPDRSVSQTRYLEALGHLRRYDSETEVDSAIHILEELAAQSTSASVQAALGRAYLAKYQLTHDVKWASPAAAACERAISSDPQNPDVHVTLGELRRSMGRLDDAINEYNAALAQQATNAEAILGLAETYKAKGKLPEAEAAYKKSIALTPNYWSGYNKLGGFYANHGRPSDGISMFQKVVELSPDNLRGYNNLGAMYERLGRYDEAVQVFSKSIAKRPTDQAYSNLGTCYYFLGRYADAAVAFERAAKLVPKRQVIWLNLGDAYRWVPGAEAKAAAAYDEAIGLAKTDLQLNATDNVTRARLAACLAKRGDLGSATRQISRAVTDDPTDINVMYNAGVVANVAGAKQAAAQYLKRAVDQGYSRIEIERDPEFSILRESAEYKTIFATRVQ
ncbi:MAG TPA: protein kinase [Thermoanaerobaculia bacterium]|jgi:serine/threonine protein kinase/tetratricopeptide (TPR) repeat protein|nr:protein kinase [Thermoanaerobaculia bacterium]